MTWRTKSTSVDIDISEFDAEQLLQGLIDAGWLTGDEAEAIEARGRDRSKALSFLGGADTEFEDARWHLSNGRRREAAVHLERFLGREWIGVLA